MTISIKIIYKKLKYDDCYITLYKSISRTSLFQNIKDWIDPLHNIIPFKVIVRKGSIHIYRINRNVKIIQA